MKQGRMPDRRKREEMNEQECISNNAQYNFIKSIKK